MLIAYAQKDMNTEGNDRREVFCVGMWQTIPLF